ncbi:MAG: sugar transferase [Lachnospiraceae bacterium]|nr:sugar transferase [Clostridiales bacterium]MCC8141172.1 sugar transferase [Lachnospiraceae bacterium]
MKKNAYQFSKRLFDLVATVLGIGVTSPIWLVAVVGIKLSDPGPVFYVAHRIGKDNQEFSMYKFRSMRQGNANESIFRGEENRIFPFGKFMRDTKIDELPQLLCILKGTMSVIGPRPAAIDQVGIVRAGKYDIASNVKPGLSGPAALYDYIFGDTVTDEKEYEEKVLPTRLELEVYYVRHCSFKYDLKLVWYTIVCIFARLFKKKPKRIFIELMECVECN